MPSDRSSAAPQKKLTFMDGAMDVIKGSSSASDAINSIKEARAEAEGDVASV